jgi:hypothetical protein
VLSSDFCVIGADGTKPAFHPADREKRTFGGVLRAMKLFKISVYTMIVAGSISLLVACSSTTKETRTTEYVPAAPRVVEVQPAPVVVPPPVVAVAPQTSSTSVTRQSTSSYDSTSGSDEPTKESSSTYKSTSESTTTNPVVPQE